MKMLMTAIVCLAMLGKPAISIGQVQPAGPVDKILTEIESNSELMENLQHLCDRIGPRVTGSEGMTQATTWARERFRDYGLVVLDPEKSRGRGIWTRGRASGRIISPVEGRLRLESAGWSCSTEGPVRGPVVHLTREELVRPGLDVERLRGAWILTHWSNLYVTTEGSAPGAEAVLSRIMRAEPAGVLLDSDQKSDHVFMIGALFGPNLRLTDRPVAMLAHSSFCTLWRLGRAGRVEVEVDLRNDYCNEEFESSNVIADLRGAERPDEYVILGAHLDSWDLGTGATDDGAGVAAVLEAARALKASGVSPKRTIRFVLFCGEEVGRLGSYDYVSRHADELPRTSAVLVQDLGAGRAKSIYMENRSELLPLMDEIVAPFRREVGLDDPNPIGLPFGSTDHMSFAERGVPGFALEQEVDEATLVGHTPHDTFEQVRRSDVEQCSKVLAAWAYQVAALPTLMPHQEKPPIRSMRFPADRCNCPSYP